MIYGLLTPRAPLLKWNLTECFRKTLLLEKSDSWESKLKTIRKLCAHMHLKESLQLLGRSGSCWKQYFRKVTAVKSSRVEWLSVSFTPNGAPQIEDAWGEKLGLKSLKQSYGQTLFIHGRMESVRLAFPRLLFLLNSCPTLRNVCHDIAETKINIYSYLLATKYHRRSSIWLGFSGFLKLMLYGQAVSPIPACCCTKLIVCAKRFMSKK